MRKVNENGRRAYTPISTPDTDTYGSSGFVRSLETNSAATAPTAAPIARSTVRDILVRRGGRGAVLPVWAKRKRMPKRKRNGSNGFVQSVVSLAKTHTGSGSHARAAFALRRVSSYSCPHHALTNPQMPLGPSSRPCALRGPYPRACPARIASACRALLHCEPAARVQAIPGPAFMLR